MHISKKSQLNYCPIGKRKKKFKSYIYMYFFCCFIIPLSTPMHYAKKYEHNFLLPRRASDGKMYFLVLLTKFAY